jgi:hypothetical protein
MDYTVHKVRNLVVNTIKGLAMYFIASVFKNNILFLFCSRSGVGPTPFVPRPQMTLPLILKDEYAALVSNN